MAKVLKTPPQQRGRFHTLAPNTSNAYLFITMRAVKAARKTTKEARKWERCKNARIILTLVSLVGMVKRSPGKKN